MHDPGFLSLQNPHHEQRPDHCRITQHFGESSTVLWCHEFPPRKPFLIGTATEPSPVIRFGTNSHPIVKSRRLHIQAQPKITDFNVGTDLLRPVPWDTSSNRENSKSLRREDMIGIAVEIE